MKSSLLISCTILYLFLNHVEISSTEPVTLTVLGVIGTITGIYSFIEGEIKSALEKPPTKERQLQFFDNIDIELSHLAKEQINLNEEIKTIVTGLGKNIQLDQLTLKVSQKIEELDHKYQNMLLFKKAKMNGIGFTKFDKTQLKNTAEINVGQSDDSIEKLVHELYLDVIGRNGGDSVVKFMSELSKQNIFATCSSNKNRESLQQKFQNLFSNLSLAYLKAYLTVRFSEEFLTEFDKDANVTHSVTLSGTTHRLEKIINLTINDFKTQIDLAPADVWRCDPKVHVKNSTYMTLDRVYRKQIMPKFYLDYNKDGCSASCSVIKSDNEASWITNERDFQRYGHVDYPIYPVHKCQELYSCQDINPGESYDYTIYHTERDIEHRNISVFESVVFSYGNRLKIYGDQDFPSIATKKQQWKKPAVDKDCGLCSCTCRDYDVPYVYAGTIKADDEHVVTGVKLVKYEFNGKTIISPKIQQGILRPYGFVDRNTVHWKDITLTNSILAESYLLEKDSKLFDMHDISLPKGSVMVGISFKKFDASTRLTITGRTFNYTTGKMYDSSVYGLEKTDKFSVTDIENTNLPKLNHPLNNFLTNESLAISTSNFRDDLGQSTIPYFDTQEVTTSVPTPMVGAGMYYKYGHDEAGFIGLKLKTLNQLDGLNGLTYDETDAAALAFDKLAESRPF